MDSPRLEDFADQQARATFTENQALARKLRAVTTELGEVTADRNRLLEESQVLQRLYDAAVTLAPEPDWLGTIDTTRSGRRLVTPVALLSDLHAGEVVRPEEMGGFNAYNVRIAEIRLREYFENVIKLGRLWMGAYEYDGIVLALLGDMISGSIHDELRETDELSVLDSTIFVAPLVLAGIEKLAEEFGRVHVIEVDGNHGRDSQRPRYKGRSAHNADTHIAKLMAWRGAGDAVTWHIPETFDAQFTVHRTRFNAVHGEEYAKTNPGTAEIGSLGPVKRGTIRAQRARAAEGSPFDINLVAHYHQLVYAPHQGFVMNGSVKGYDEYARGLSLKPEPPQQAMFLVDPEYGPTLHAPIRCDAGRLAEGW